MAFNSIQNIYGIIEGVFEANGFEEWQDAFNIENIPSSRINKSFHINLGRVSREALDMNMLTMSSSVEVSWFMKGFKYPKDAKLEAHKLIEKLYIKLLNVGVRTTSGVLNILPEDTTIEAINVNNDNIVIVRMTYNVLTVLDLQQTCN